MICWPQEHRLNIKLTLYVTTDSEMLADGWGMRIKVEAIFNKAKGYGRPSNQTQPFLASTLLLPEVGVHPLASVV